LRSVERSPGFASLLMVFLTTSSINVYTRLQAAIYFKNYIKRFWAPVRHVAYAIDRFAIVQY